MKKSNKVYGEIKVYKERFIHLDSKLRFAIEVNESEPSSSSSSSNIFEFQTLLEDREDTKKAQKEKNNYWVDTIFNTVQINLESFSKIIYEEETKNLDSLNQESAMAFEDLYEIKKDVKIEDNEFNFIDHPFFSKYSLICRNVASSGKNFRNLLQMANLSCRSLLRFTLE